MWALRLGKSSEFLPPAARQFVDRSRRAGMVPVLVVVIVVDMIGEY